MCGGKLTGHNARNVLPPKISMLTIGIKGMLKIGIILLNSNGSRFSASKSQVA